MVLKLHDSEIEITSCPNDLNQFLSQYINKNTSLEFASKPIRTIKPSDGKTLRYSILSQFDENFRFSGLVYVGQREVAFLNTNQEFGLNYLGSEDATTCHIIVLQNSRTKLTALAHLDSVKSKGLDCVCKKLCLENSNDEIVVHVFGGYEDENQTSEELSLKLFKYLIRSEFHFALGYCVIGAVLPTCLIRQINGVWKFFCYSDFM